MLEDIVYYQEGKYGVLSNPSVTRELPLIIFLNAGIVYRIGPNRVYVKMCRELNEIGFTCFRFDLPGVGDHINDSRSASKAEMYFDAIEEVVRYFRKSKGFQSFVLCGLCSGANLAYDYACREKSITGVCMVNGTRIPAKGLVSNIKSRYYRKYLTDGRRWMRRLSPEKLAKLPGYFFMLGARILKKGRRWLGGGRKESAGQRADSAFRPEPAERWKRLLNSEVEVLQIISEGSESLDFINGIGKETLAFNASKKNYRECIIHDADHTFTSIESQQKLINEVVGWFNIKYRS